MNRRRYLHIAIILSLLIMCAWLRGWLTDSDTDITNTTTTLSIKDVPPIVYLDKHITNTNLSFQSQFQVSRPTIPRIIHQTWKTSSIPSKFVPLVKTWLRVNPDYQYWFWTDKDADRFIKTYYPEYYDLFRHYPQNIMRADAIRYFILYHFGGWYADMDMEARKPFEQYTNSHHCIISQEPWGHTKLFWNKERLACNALMAARPNHPFFDLVIKELPKAAKRVKDVMSMTGPKLIDTTVTLYEATYQGKNYDHSMTLYLADPDTFLPTVASNALASIKKICVRRQSDPAKQKICDRFKKENYQNLVPDTAITNHVWVHTYYGIDEKKNEDIFSLIPHARSARKILDDMERKKN